MVRLSDVPSPSLMTAEIGRRTGKRKNGASTIPFVDLRAQYAAIRSEITTAVHHVMSNVNSIRGEEVECFEWEFASFYRVPTAVGVSSGTEALQLALLACDVGPNDEVITTTFAPKDVADAICGINAVPVFVDIENSTYNMDPTEIESVITDATKVILPVHLYGRPADMGRILGVARRYGLRVVETAGHAHGARYQDRLVGTMGDMGCFSCRPDENLGAYGEAGVIISASTEYGSRLRRLRDQGERRKYGRFRPRPSSRMDPLQAAVLRVKLRHLEEWNQLRKNLADRYRRELKGLPLTLPAPDGTMRPSHSMFVVRTPRRDWLHAELQRQHVSTAVHYPLPLHLDQSCRFLHYAPGDFPRSELAARQVLSLPLYAEMVPEQVGHVAEVIRGALEQEEAGRWGGSG